MGLYKTYIKLLVEQVTNSEIIEAIDNKEVVEFYYEGDETESRGARTVEIYAFGNSTKGNPVIRAYQTGGATDSSVPNWKLFDVRNIRNFKTVGNFEQPRQGFNLNGDAGMLNVYHIAKF